MLWAYYSSITADIQSDILSCACQLAICHLPVRLAPGIRAEMRQSISECIIRDRASPATSFWFYSQINSKWLVAVVSANVLDELLVGGPHLIGCTLAAVVEGMCPQIGTQSFLCRIGGTGVSVARPPLLPPPRPPRPWPLPPLPLMVGVPMLRSVFLMLQLRIRRYGQMLSWSAEASALIRSISSALAITSVTAGLFSFHVLMLGNTLKL